MKQGLFRSAFVAALVGSAALAQPVLAGAVITFGSTSLGVNDSGELNFTGDGPEGFGTYGVFRSGVGDAISPGCFCEGWGVSTTYGGITTSGFANQSSGFGGLTGGTFSSNATSANSTIGLADAPIRINHFFGASAAPDTFQVNVTITNAGTEIAQDLTYRRVMDWDVPPTTFNEYVTHSGVTANLVSNGGSIKFASNNGFASGDPLSGESWINEETINTDFVANGPTDHGSLFDFSFGDLAPGESRLFNIYYGSAATKVEALSQIATVGANVYSLGQNSNEDGVDPGTPATFFFAFGGVGGIEPGLTPETPVMPIVETDPRTGAPIFTFAAPTARRWFDPPYADGFVYTLEGGAEFTEIGAPPLSLGFAGPFTISSGGSTLGVIAPGETFMFGSGITSFTLSGISELLDTAAPGFASAFPVFLDWRGSASLLTITPTLVPDPVPEPNSWVMLIAGFGLTGAALRRRRLRLA
jgi:hypothetical protein